MRKNSILFLAVTFISILTCPRVFSQKPLNTDDDTPKNVIKLKPFALVLGMVTLQYEHAFGPHISGACDVSFLSRAVSATPPSGKSSSQDFSAKISGFGISPEFRYYASKIKPAPKGLYAAPFLEFYSLSLSASGVDSSSGRPFSATLNGINGIGGGALLGWQFLIGNVFSIDINSGFRYISFSSPGSFEYTINGQKKVGAIGSFAASGIGFAGNIALGFAF
jgi:hypothetical protein